MDAISWDNNVILFLDIYDDYGIGNMDDLVNGSSGDETWNRLFSFYNLNPDFFLATWDTNTNPQFWYVEEGRFESVIESGDEGLGYEDYATFNTGESGRSLEAKIPWAELYYSDERSMVNYPNIKFLAVITGGGDHTAGPDSAPDNLSGMPSETETVVLDNYVMLSVDQNGDGVADSTSCPIVSQRFSNAHPSNRSR